MPTRLARLLSAPTAANHGAGGPVARGREARFPGFGRIVEPGEVGVRCRQGQAAANPRPPQIRRQLRIADGKDVADEGAVVITRQRVEPADFVGHRAPSLARDEGNKGDHVLAPLADDSEVDRILGELAWRPVSRGASWQRLSKAYVTVFVIGLSPVILLLGLIVGALSLVPLTLDPVVAENVSQSLRPMLLSASILLSVVAVAILLRWLAWHRAAYALDGDRLLVRNGWWRRRLTILPTAKIQSIDVAENLVSRLAALPSVKTCRPSWRTLGETSRMTISC